MGLRTGLSAAALALYLSSCGGGGGGGMQASVPTSLPPAPPPPAPVDPATFRTSEYGTMGALEQIHAAEAYALGYTGQGVIIGIVDFNFVFSSSDVNFHPDSVGPNPAMQALDAALFGPVDTDQHGQAVAATAAALKNDSGIQGVAFNAQVLAVDYYSDVNNVNQTDSHGNLYHVSDPFTYITSRGGRIINTSFGYESGSGVPLPPPSNVPGHPNEYYEIESSATAIQNGALLVASAGNGNGDGKGHGANPSQSNFDTISDLGGTSVLDSSTGAFIIAGAVDSSNTIASFSDRAGSLKNYYMVAPGVHLTLPWNGSLTSVSGTSFSAPLISGAAALIMQRWPTLTAHQVAQILFDSATDLGAPGVDSIYGHGLLNVYAALQASGVTTMVVAGGSDPQVLASGMVLGTAFGDAPAFRAAGAHVMMLDGYGRDYAIDLSKLTYSAPTLSSLAGALQQKEGWHASEFSVGTDTRFAFQIHDNKDDWAMPLRSAGGPENEETHSMLFRFAGAGGGVEWAAGTGMSLSDALAWDRPDASTPGSLTKAFSTTIGAPGAFATIALPLSAQTGISFGFGGAQIEGVPEQQIKALRYSTPMETAALRLDDYEGASHFAIEIGGIFQRDGILGSISSGGMKLADHSSTQWTTFKAYTPLNWQWAVQGSFTVAQATGDAAEGSVFTSVGPISATGFSLGLVGNDVFRSGDVLAFTLSQPIRAEDAPISLTTGVARDAAGAITMATTRSSLSPSGREFDLEAAYRFHWGEWNGEANVAYSHDAGHVSGSQGAQALIYFTRRL